ncbi:FUSC family protein [Collinsella intestinalis]|uniref:FUSC family protein n=1 Tax=Collinsella intestinalis TaxID=147207 RepID=UPI00195C02C1
MGRAVSRLGDILRTWRRDTLPELPSKIKKAFPVAAFFIVLFWVVVGLFGMSHVMPVSCYTTLFNVRHRKYNTAGQYLRFFFVSYLALAAARIATLNVILCIAMNVVMPFVFVFMRSSQLNPRRYFPYMMLFVFLQLRPELLDNLLLEAALLTVCCAVLTVSLIIAGLVVHKDDADRARLHEMVTRLADKLDHMADTGITMHTRQELLRLRTEYAKLAYQVREDANAQASVSNLFDMFAMLAQRTAYLVGRLEWNEGPGCSHAPYLRKLAGLTRAVEIVLDRRDKTAAIEQARILMTESDGIANDRFRLFYRSYLAMTLLVLQDAGRHLSRRWRLSPLIQLRIASFRKHPTLDSFELRFSVRCASVLAISCAVSLAVPIDHLYWFPLTAFLLIQPFPAESVHRMRTRTIGTVLGCLAVYAFSAIDLPYGATMLVAMVLISCLYVSTPGGTVIAFFATSYALTMVTLSISGEYAIGMRIACLIAAAALVSVVNRLVLPTSDRTLFLANVHELFSLLERYWGLLRRSLDGSVDAVTASEALLHIQMVHSQAVAYALTFPEDSAEERENKQATRRVLFCLWELVCELEQLGFLLRVGAVDTGEYPELDRFMAAAEACSNPFAVDARLAAAASRIGIFAEDDVRYLLTQYLRRARTLADALTRARETTSGRPTYREEVAEVAVRGK